MKTEAVEDYLKAIYVLQSRHRRARTSALAERLGVTPGSVTEMLKRLSATKPFLVEYRMHHGAVLTEQGRRAALSVIRRHRLLETFLHDVFAFSWDEIHTEAEKLEHCLSDRLTDAIDTHLDHPRYDPHGEPIPNRDLELPTEAGSRLSRTAPGTVVRITRIRDTDPALLRYLSSMGIRIGTCFRVIEAAPFDGPFHLARVNGETVHLSRHLADSLEVEEMEAFPP